MKSESSNSSCCGGVSCCSVYEHDWVEDFLGESFHPGGPELSGRSIESLQITPGTRVLDIACGRGSSAVKMAELGANVLATDASPKQLELAKSKLVGGESIQFQELRAEAVPEELGPFDGILCECAFSLVQDQEKASQAWFKVLAPGGRLSISDMIVNQPLPPSLAGEIGNLACLGNAQSVEQYTSILSKAGFQNIVYHDEGPALLETLSSMKRKLLVYGISRMAEITNDIGFSLAEMKNALNDAKSSVKSGALSYGRISAHKPE
ncbi:class I SAM-dependent methyltransferase [Pelagicoccus mobilis]|uniref:Methyltransferase domain-containing protein n=1 Tax=Pelagicoccus mobilis TaxID=415221 RepID=A0A934S0K2_9BACT|nr:class I SAM-dependent methyltransferase [Pelagicoccus mobilis]MBK1880106.1 methyltransferase domain-containing protein [Pelagicoccus mobilis]